MQMLGATNSFSVVESNMLNSVFKVCNDFEHFYGAAAERYRRWLLLWLLSCAAPTCGEKAGKKQESFVSLWQCFLIPTEAGVAAGRQMDTATWWELGRVNLVTKWNDANQKRQTGRKPGQIEQLVGTDRQANT